MTQRVAGACYIKANGEQFEIAGDVECPLAPTKKEAVMAVAGLAGYKETAVRQYIKLKAVLVPGFPIDTIVSATDLVITAELANGKVYTLSGGFLEGDAPAKAIEGEVDLEFSGKKGTWK